MDLSLQCLLLLLLATASYRVNMMQSIRVGRHSDWRLAVASVPAHRLAMIIGGAIDEIGTGRRGHFKGQMLMLLLLLLVDRMLLLLLMLRMLMLVSSGHSDGSLLRLLLLL